MKYIKLPINSNFLKIGSHNFKKLYFKYPKSKFILTIRKNEEEWFDSLVRHSKRHPSTKQRLKVYGHYDPNESNKIDHITIYNNHNTDVQNFFKENNPDRLLVISTDDSNKEEKIYKFINKPFDKDNLLNIRIKMKENEMDLTNLDCYYGGYGSTFIYNESSKIPSYTLDQIKTKYNLKFNVLVADCEGFLEVFF